MKFKKDDEGKLVLDEKGDPIAISESGEAIPLDKVVSLVKHQRIESERDDLKEQLDKLQGQVADLGKLSGDKEALEKKVAEMQEASERERGEYESKITARTRDYALDTTLLASGVPADRLKAAKAYVDAEKLELEGEKLKGFDVESFKKEHEYLFESTDALSGGLPPRGRAKPDPESMSVDEYAKARADGLI